MLIVQKYGGSSLANVEKIKNVASRIAKLKEKGNKLVVVVSAMGKSTDNLIKLAKSLNEHPSKREMDMLLSTGEMVSISLLAMALENLGKKAVSLTGSQAGIKTDNIYSKARILDINKERINKELENNNIVIIAGFQGINSYNDITTLGRGGSDTTAVAVAKAINADVCEILTDVESVYTVDPKMVKNPKKIKEISYDEMLILASQGSKVLHERSVELAKIYNVKLHLRSSFKEIEGTIVQGDKNMIEKEVFVTSVAYEKDMVKLTIFGVLDKPGIASSVFKSLADKNVNTGLISQSSGDNGVNRISVLIKNDERNDALDALNLINEKLEGTKVELVPNLNTVTVVGVGLLKNPMIVSKIFELMGENNINIEMISTSEISISIAINEKYLKKAIEAISKHFQLCD